ncbi:hypothetical protein E2986_13428 [Frieseomelitta varia]|uniref:Uncharacterized protein n=1 Tax=Frieseomelitta varia TaxID=561572 RepID=A0A833W3I0_9HYME|nr:hypothetical protein E2986_13428 [Frieseomelitta varia]
MNEHYLFSTSMNSKNNFKSISTMVSEKACNILFAPLYIYIGVIYFITVNHPYRMEISKDQRKRRD